MSHLRLTLIGTLACVALVIASCAPAAPQPTAAPAAPKPTAAPAKPAATAAPAKSAATAKPAEKAAEKPAAKAAEKPAAKATEKPAEKAAAKPAAKPTGAPVKIGFIAPLSGPVAVYGAALKFAPELVLRETNESGGINGSPLEIVTIDSPNNPNQTVTGMRRLANDDKAFAVMGPYYTGEMQVAAPIATQLKVPLVAYDTAGSHPGSVEPSPWVFLLDSTEERTASLALDGFKKAYPNVKKIAVAGDTQVAVTAITIKEVWPKILPEKGFEIVDTVTFQFTTSDFSPIATRLKASGAEGLALSALSPAGPSLLKEMERQGIKIPVVSSSHMHTVPPLPKIAGATADGLVQTMFFNPDLANTPQVAAWRDKYIQLAASQGVTIAKEDFGYAQEPHTYDSFNIVIKVMREAGIKSDTPLAEAREKIQAGVAKLKDYPGILGTKKSTNQDNRITLELFPLIAKDGMYQSIK